MARQTIPSLRGHGRKMTLVELIIIVAIFAIVLGGLFKGCAFIMGGPHWQTSDGFRDGWLQKLSHKGAFVKSWEGELALPGYGGSHKDKPGQSGGGAWAFTVDDHEIVEQLQALPPNAYVRLHYVEYVFNGWGDTGYRVTRVQRIDE